jgi:pimeloyl-ACP methyl ester carboxylesterase
MDSIRGQRDTTTFYRNIQQTIGKKWGPRSENIAMRAVLGAWDPLAKDEVVAQWIEHLPQLYGHVKRFDRAGHFIEETHPEEVAEAIADVAGLK